MNRRYFAFSLAGVGLSMSLGCNSLVGNDDGFVLSLDHGDGGGLAPGSDPGSSTAQAADDGTDAAIDPEASVTTPPDGDPDAGATGGDVDAGSSTIDASTGSSMDSGSSSACPGTQVRCGGVCVDLQNDPLHCGTCATVCNAPPMCKDGKCKHGGN